MQGSSLTVDGMVDDALQGEVSEEVVEQVTAAYREAINAALPGEVQLCGDEFYADVTYTGDRDDVRSVVNEVDFWEVVETVTSSNSAS